jgi:hypothetical protein
MTKAQITEYAKDAKSYGYDVRVRKMGYGDWIAQVVHPQTGNIVLYLESHEDADHIPKLKILPIEGEIEFVNKYGDPI